MTEQVNVGRLTLDVVADTGGVRRGLDARLKAELANTKAKIKAEVDPRGLRRGIQQAVTQAQADARAQIKVEVDRRGLAAELRRAVREAQRDAGAAQIKVTAKLDAAGLRRDVRTAAQAAATDVRLQVTADTSEARREIARLRAEERRPVRIPVGSSGGGAGGRAGGGGGGGGGGGDLGEAGDKLTQVGRLASMAAFGLSAVQAAGAGVVQLAGGLGQVAAGVLSIAVNAAQAGPALAVIPAGLGAILQTAGTAVAAFAGIGDAVTALRKKEETAAATSDAAAKTRATGLRRIADAQDALRQAQDNVAVAQQQSARRVQQAQQSVADAHRATLRAQQDVARTAVQGAQQIADAEQRVADAQQSVADAVRARIKTHQDGARRIVDAERTVSDAQVRVAEAMRARVDAHEQGVRRILAAERQVSDAGEQVAAAVRAQSDTHAQGLSRVADAEQRVGDTQRQVVQDQLALTRARQDARDRLEDLRLSLQGAALDEEGAALAVQRAQQTLELARTDPRQSALDVKEADLAYREALQRQQEVQASNADLRAEAADAMKKGVQGADNVVAAQQGLTDSQRAAQAAQADLTKTRQDATQADADAATTTVRARRDQADAEQALADTRKQAAADDANAARAEAGARRDESDAEQGLADARRNAADADAQATRTEVRAQQDQQQAVAALAQTRQDAAQANADAVQQMLDARRTEKRSEQDLVTTRQDAARANAQAVQQVVQAQRSLADAQDALQTATSKTGAAATAAEVAMGKLSPAGQRFARFIAGTVMPQVDKLRAAAQEAVLPGAQQAIGNLMALARPVTAIVRETGAVISDLMVRASELVSTPAWQRDILTIGRGNATALGLFGKAALNLLAPLRDILVVVSRPGGLLDRFGKWTVGLSENIAQTIGADRRTGKLAKTMDRAGDVVAQWYRIIRNVLVGLRNIASEAAPAGQALTNSLEGASRDFVKWTEDHKDDIRRFFNASVPVARSFGRILLGIAKIIGDVMNNPENLRMMRAIETQLVPAVDRLVNALSNSGSGTVLVDIITSLANGVTNLINSGAFGRFTDSLAYMADLFERITASPIGQSVIGGLLAVAGIVGPIALVAGWFAKLAKSVDKISRATGLNRVVTTARDAAMGGPAGGGEVGTRTGPVQGPVTEAGAAPADVRTRGQQRRAARAQRRLAVRTGAAPTRGARVGGVIGRGLRRPGAVVARAAGAVGRRAAQVMASDDAGFLDVGAMAGQPRQRAQAATRAAARPGVLRRAGGAVARAGGAVARAGGRAAASRVGRLGARVGAGGILAAGASMLADPIANRIDDRRGGARSALAGAVSGGVTGAGIGATIGSIVPVVGTAIGGAVGGATGAIIGAVNNTIGWDKVWTAVKTQATKMWGGITDAASTVGPAVGRFFTGLPGQVAGAATSFGTWIANTATGWYTGATGWLGRVGAAVLGFFTGLPGQVAAAATAVGTWLARQGTSLFTSATSWLGRAATAYVNFWINLPGRVAGAVAGVARWLGARAGELLSTVTGWLGTALQRNVTFWSTLPARLAAYAQALRTWLSRRWGEFVTDVGSRLTNMRDRTVNFVRDLPGNLRAQYATLRAWWGARWDEIKALPGKAMDAANKSIGTWLTTMRTTFSTGVTSLGKAWDRFKDAVKGPVRWVLDQVYNRKIVNPFRSLANKFGITSERLLPSTIDLSHFATGGVARKQDLRVIPGYTPGRDVGVIGVGGGEAVMRPEWTRAMGEKAVEEMNRVARTTGATGVRKYLVRSQGALGGLLGNFQSGGVVPRGTRAAMIALGRVLQGRGFNVAEGPAPFGPVHHVHAPGSLHYSGNAIDVNRYPGTSAREQHAIDQILPLIRQYGLHYLWRIKGHLDHIHIDTANRSNPLGSVLSNLGGLASGALDFLGGLNPVEWLRTQVTGALSKLNSVQYGGGLPGSIMGAGARRLMGYAGDAMTHLMSRVGDFGAAAGGAAAGIWDKVFGGTRGDVQKQVKALAGTRGWGGGGQWAALSALINKESGWNPRAQNPTSTAYGLFQFLNSTWASVGARKTSDVASQVRAGLAYIARAYGNPIRAWAFHRAHNWYAKGGVVPRLLARFAPALAAGATVQPRPGGTVVRVAERGRAESVVDTGLMNRRLAELDLLRTIATQRGALVDHLELSVGNGATVEEGLSDVMWWLRKADRGGVHT